MQSLWKRGENVAGAESGVLCVSDQQVLIFDRYGFTAETKENKIWTLFKQEITFKFNLLADINEKKITVSDTVTNCYYMKKALKKCWGGDKPIRNVKHLNFWIFGMRTCFVT